MALSHPLNSFRSRVAGLIYRMAKKMINGLSIVPCVRQLAGTAVFAAFMLAFCAAPAFSSRLATNYASVYAGNLKIGGSYNLTEAANLPMWLSYEGDIPVMIQLEVVKAGGSDLRAGYEPIPDTSWITFSKDRFEVKPGESENIDVIVNVPNDKNLCGKKYQLFVFASTVPMDNSGGVKMAMGIKGKLSIDIADDAAGATVKPKRKASLGIMVMPEKVTADAGSREALINATEAEPVKIINPSREKVDVSIAAVDPSEFGMPAPKGYAAGSAGDVKLSAVKGTLKPDSILNIDIELKNRKEMFGKKRMYLVRIIAKSEKTEIAKFVKIYLE